MYTRKDTNTHKESLSSHVYKINHNRNFYFFQPDEFKFISLRIQSLLASVSRPALGSTQPPVQWVPGVLSPGVKRGRRVTLTTHPI
jgi:hypothetical protein